MARPAVSGCTKHISFPQQNDPPLHNRAFDGAPVERKPAILPAALPHRPTRSACTPSIEKCLLCILVFLPPPETELPRPRAGAFFGTCHERKESKSPSSCHPRRWFCPGGNGHAVRQRHPWRILHSDHLPLSRQFVSARLSRLQTLSPATKALRAGLSLIDQRRRP